ncbi:MAG: hypothetical protein AAGG11_10365 [Pseudomonadota bacterium]
METPLLELARQLEATGLGAALLTPVWLLPVLAVAHLFGMMLLVGSLVLFDVRLLGLSFQTVAVREMYGRLQPLLVLGLLLTLLSGGSLFLARPTAIAASPYLLLKGLLLLLAVANALWFRTRFRRADLAGAEVIRTEQPAQPGFARGIAALSMALWAAVIVCGTLLSESAR